MCPSAGPEPTARRRAGVARDGLAAALVLLACGQAQAQAASGGGTRQMTADLQASLAYTDTSESPTANGSSWVASVRPSVGLTSRSGRVQGSGRYSLGLSRYSGRSRDAQADADAEVQHALDAKFTAEAVENRLYLEGTGNVSQTSLSALGQQTAEGSPQRNVNRTEVASVSMAPYLKGALGTWATYRLRFEARASNTHRSITADSSGSSTTFDLASSSGGSVFGWGLTAARDQSSFRRGRGVETRRVVASVSLTPDPEIRFTFRGGQEETNALTVDTERYDNWGVDVRWTPNERTLANLSSDHRYYGPSHQFTLSHRFPLSALSFTSARSVSDSASPSTGAQPITLFDIYFALYASAYPDPVAREQFVRAFLLSLGMDPSMAVAGGFVNSTASVQSRHELAWTYSGRRATLALQAFSSLSRELATSLAGADAGGVRQNGYTANLAHRLTPTASVALVGQRLMTKASLSGAATDLKSLGLTLTDQISRRASANLGVRHSVFDSPTDPYRESAVTASISMQF